MKAINIVHWPGQDTLACEMHTRQLRNLDNIIGLANLSVTPLPEDSEVECENCKNASKR